MFIHKNYKKTHEKDAILAFTKKLCYNEKYWTYMCLLIKKYCIFNANFLRQIKH